MAEQLHYTSAPAGLSGRPGFQFVAASPGASSVVQQAVVPYLGYQPPPSAPSRPGPAELAAFPVAYTFARDRDSAILVQCRYLGTDYSGRYGNFLGHAVVADAAQLAEGSGLRPIELLWGSPVWAGTPAAGPDLPELSDLPAGTGADPDAVAAWLAAGGAGRYALLAELVDASLASLDGRAGQVVLVAGEVATVAHWVAAVSYSLPLAQAWDLSFVTYTADAGRARTHLVGTTTDAWAGGDGRSRAFLLDEPSDPGPTAAGRYPAALARAWQRRDLADVDAVNELVTSLATRPEERDAAVALAELCRGVRLDRVARTDVAELLPRCADRLPQWVWQGLAEADLGSVGEAAADLELSLAVHQAAERTGRAGLADRAGAFAAAHGLQTATGLAEVAEVVELAARRRLRMGVDDLRAATQRQVTTGGASLGPVLAAAGTLGGGHRAAVLDGAVAGLARAGRGLIDQVLPPEVCDELVDRDWEPAPRLGARVLATSGRRHPARRVGITDQLTDLAVRARVPAEEIDSLVRAVWDDPEPGAAECRQLIRLLSAEQADLRCIRDLFPRAFLAADLADPDTVALAQRVQQQYRADPAGLEPAGAAAATVLAADRIAHHDPDGYLRLDQLRGIGQRDLRKRAVAAAQKAFAAAPPPVQAAVLARLRPDNPLRRELAKTIITRRPPSDQAGRAARAEVAVRMWVAGHPDPKLTEWTLSWAGNPQTGRQLRRDLAARDRDLVPQLEKLYRTHAQRRPTGQAAKPGLRDRVRWPFGRG